MKTWIASVLATAVLLITGVLHGLTTDRWTTPEILRNASARLQNVPSNMGEWTSEDLKLDDRTLALAEATGYLSRHYLHQPTGASVNVLVLCGRPGPIATHPPTVCFTASGMRIMKESVPHTVFAENEEPLGQFWLTEFVKPTDAIPYYQRTYWGWSANGEWLAAENPRIQFAPYPFLYKMYISRKISKPDEPLEEDISIEFMRMFIPELHKTLFGETAAAPAESPKPKQAAAEQEKPSEPSKKDE